MRHHLYVSAIGIFYSCTNNTQHCDEHEGTSNAVFRCGNVNECHFTCEQYRCAKYAVIDASNANQLYIHSTDNSQECFLEADFLLPDHGNATFTSDPNAVRAFKGTFIESGTNTSNIIIDIQGKGVNDDDLIGMVISAKTAQYVEVTISNGMKWRNGELYCPVNSRYRGPEIAPCMVDLTDAETQDTDIFAPEGIPKNVWVEIDENVPSNYDELWIKCLRVKQLNSVNAGSNGKWSQIPVDTDDNCWWTNNPTMDPTIDPTMNPTVEPTAAPSMSPTYSPSTAPSSSPTDSTTDPTNAPSIAPTKTPSGAPSFSPSNAPSFSPTTAPTLAPSQIPTAAPSFSPTIAPSQAPSLAPSLAPTMSPTVAPSQSPTTAPTIVGSSTQTELFMYYNMEKELKDVILTVFNEKIAFATELAIKHAAYNNSFEKYKFIYQTYTCAAFTIYSFDGNVFAADPYSELINCDIYKSALSNGQSSDNRYDPATKSADYLSILKVVLTGDDDDDSENKAKELEQLLDFNGTNATTTATQRRLQTANNETEPVDFKIFKSVIDECMKGDYGEPKDQTCSGFLGLNLEKFQVVSLDAGLYDPPPKEFTVVTLGQKIVIVFQFFIYIFIGICLLLSVGGRVYAKKIGSDNVKAFGILFFSLYTWDFYSDIMFCVRLVDAKQWELFGIGLMFIFIPWAMNLVQLFREQKKWTSDPLTKEKVTGWLISYNIILIFAVIVSGNSFGAVELANSNLFAIDLFSMGLNPRNLKEFQAQRLFSSVLLENLPQLAIQIVFLSIIGKFDEPTLLSLSCFVA